MARLYFETLSEESAGFLESEGSRRRAHTAMILVFAPGTFGTPDGGVDFERIREIVAIRLAELPRLRSKLRRVPLDGNPVWVDDAEFNIDYHLRQSSLPRPGNHDQLCRTAARITASRLDRSRPLWDCWVLEGLEGGRFAIVLKMHKALANLEGADLLRALLSTSEERVTGVAARYKPRPAPSPFELFTSEVIRGWAPSRRAATRTLGLLLHPSKAGQEIRDRAKGMLKVMGYKLRPAGESPFDGNLGPHRSFSMQEVDLDAVQRLRQAWGGTIHDGVLTILTGALRRFVEERRISSEMVDLRALTPVLDVEGRKARSWVVELPIWEDAPYGRHRVICEQNRRIGTEDGVASGEVLAARSEWNASRLFVIGARALKTIESGQLAVLQSPGSRRPLYMDGARLEECYGILPLQDSSGLGVTVLSYDGSLFFAFNADTDIVPDVQRLRDLVDLEVAAVLGLVEEGRPPLRAVGGGVA